MSEPVKFDAPAVDDGTTYTLTEAAAVLNAQMCQNVGHPLTLTAITPESITCPRCGTAWTLTEQVG